jgi:trans-aconitate 2-methyltransferase
MSVLCSSTLVRSINRQGTSKQLIYQIRQTRIPQGSLVFPLQRSIHSSATKMSAQSDWNAAQYLKFEGERSLPIRDLIAKIPLDSPKHVVDLGCGTATSTAVLAQRYPDAQLKGIDSSPNMIAKARETLPSVDFAVENLATFTPDKAVDLFLSNAVFHWVPRNERLEIIARLVSSQNSGGVFAFQVPDNYMEPSHLAMRETAAGRSWADTLSSAHLAIEPFQSPEEIYDRLKSICSHISIWHTTYHHVLKDHQAIVEWVKGTGLKPFVDPLQPDLRELFLEAYLQRIKEVYPSLSDGKVMLHYPRLFVVAVRA